MDGSAMQFAAGVVLGSAGLAAAVFALPPLAALGRLVARWIDGI